MNIEFGQPVLITTLVPENAEAVVRDHYEKTKAARFPTWDGDMRYIADEDFPLYKVYGWRADVPEEHVL